MHSQEFREKREEKVKRRNSKTSKGEGDRRQIEEWMEERKGAGREEWRSKRRGLREREGGKERREARRRVGLDVWVSIIT